MKKNRPNFRLQRINSDGSSEEPMLYAIEETDGEWKMGRRGFLATSFALAGMATGCSSVQSPVETGSVTREPGTSGAADKDNAPDEQATASTSQPSAPRSVSEKKSPNTVSGICNSDVSAHFLNVRTLLFVGDGKYLVSGGKEDVLKVWEFPSGKLIRTNSDMPTKSMALGGVEKELIATATDDGSGILLYNVRSGEILDNLREARYDYINCVAFDPTGTCMASGRMDNKITLWNIVRRNRIRQLGQHTEEVTALAFSPDGRFLASGARGEILLWSVQTWQVIRRIKVGNISSVTRLTFSPDSQLLAVGATYDSTVRIMRIPSGEKHCTLKGHDPNQDKVFAFSQNGGTIATGALNNRICLWNIETGKPFLILEGRQNDSIKSLVFSQDGKYLVAGSEDSIKIWMMPEGELLTCLLDPSTVPADIKINQYTMRDRFGHIITFTLPCGSPIPPGAVCVCNCVPGSMAHAPVSSSGRSGSRSRSRSSGTKSRSRSYCSCNQVCTCVPVMY